MADTVVRQGLTVKLEGEPAARVVGSGHVGQAGLRPVEFEGVKTRPLVESGDKVKIGTPLLEDKARPDVKFASAVAGTVKEVRRGERRALLAVIVESDGSDSAETFPTLDPATAEPGDIRAGMLAAGLWPLLRQQPYGKIPHPGDTPKAIFVSAMKQSDFDADPVAIAEGEKAAWEAGLRLLAKLSPGGVQVGVAERGTNGFVSSANWPDLPGVTVHSVRGKFPAGNPAVQGHHRVTLRPGETFWTLGLQDVIALGHLALEGTYYPYRTIALAGTGLVRDHRTLVKTRLGVVASELVEGKLDREQLSHRIISGDAFGGKQVAPDEPIGLGDTLVTVLPEGTHRRELLGWLWPGFEKLSYSRAYLSALLPGSTEFIADTNLNGGHRACIQSGSCLEVCPTNVPPLFVFKAVQYDDIEEAEKLGIHDCVGCGLCTFVCPSKIEIAEIIHQGLAKIQKEG